MEPNQIHYHIARQILSFHRQVEASKQWRKESEVIISIEMIPHDDDPEQVNISISAHPVDSLEKDKMLVWTSDPRPLILIRRDTNLLELLASILANTEFNHAELPRLLFENKGFNQRRKPKTSQYKKPRHGPNTSFSNN